MCLVCSTRLNNIHTNIVLSQDGQAFNVVVCASTFSYSCNREVPSFCASLYVLSSLTCLFRLLCILVYSCLFLLDMSPCVSEEKRQEQPIFAWAETCVKLSPHAHLSVSRVPCLWLHPLILHHDITTGPIITENAAAAVLVPGTVQLKSERKG